ncbi:MAG: AAC(3) family N-acetyltransferase, partial [Armatimonadetes bacterium]|nr:AAC(3) family N-acetyltransferase [Armatimonadota bacterium]
MALTKRQLVEDLRKLGVKQGDSLMVHSALSALGLVRGGADTVIDALLEAVGSEGNVAMPLMTGNGVF